MPGKLKLNASDYVHLHNHTEHSLLDGLTKISPLVKFVSEQGMDAVAITDHGTLSGAIEFYKAAKSNKVKPIIGIETYIATRSHTDKDPAKDKNRFHLILLAMNNKGYENLMKLSTTANLDGFYYFPRIDHDLIEQYNEGLICLSGCMGGELGSAIMQGQLEQAEEIAKYYKKIFGDRYYLEIQDHGHPKNPLYNKEQERANNQIIKLGDKLNIPVVLTCDAHYLKHDDQEAHEVLLCVGTASYLDQTNRMTLKDFPLHVATPQELIDRWGSDHPEAIKNTKLIADRCNVNIEFGKILLPKFELPKGKNETDLLKELVYQGLAWRYADLPAEDAKGISVEDSKKKLPKEVVDRSEYELAVINKMGFNSYFLVIADFINWGIERGIVFGPGRGSAAGSIISYALRITGLDPLLYDLLFERFLNPERISMPDIDIDIQDSRRDEVIQYCIDKYGKDRVANIATFGRMYARNAVRDVARVLEVPYAAADTLAKMLPLPIQGRHIPLEKSIEDDSDLKYEYNSNPTSKRVLDLAVKLEGTIRSHGVHAAGIVIAPDELVKFAPLEMAQKGVVATQYPLGPIEDLGLLKMDLLGLSNLTTIKNALRIIKKVYKKDIDIAKIPLDDKKTIELFKKGDTTGVFQFESAGMKRYLKELQPTVFEDIIAMNALYRPGPMQWVDEFISRKTGKKKIEYMHSSMMNAIENTYGVIVYQEQVMQISKDMCGFSGAQADMLRKAISKKKPEELAKMRSEFVEGAVKTVKADRKMAEKLWTQLEDFAAYCFNKSHAACYSLIAYQTAYLKAHYPVAFMAALLTSDYNDTDRLSIEISECQHMGINVLPPDINESFFEFAIVPGSEQIRFGLIAIKNVGTSAVEDILLAREGGAFTSLEDFFSRVNSRVVNHKTLESLIKAGAFDGFGERNYLLSNLDVLMAFSNRINKDKNNGQTDLFSSLDSTSVLPKVDLKLMPSSQPVSQPEKLSWERELLGIYLSEHPLDAYKQSLADRTIPLNSIGPNHHNKSVSVGGTITQIRNITTKNGQKMAFVKIEDQYGEIELILFPGVFQTYGSSLLRDKVYVATGKLVTKDRNGNNTDELKVLVDTLEEIETDSVAGASPKKSKKESVRTVPLVVSRKPIKEVKPKRLFIRLDNSQNHELLQSLKQAIDDNDGQTDVLLVLGDTNDKQVIKLPMKVNPDNESLSKITELVGAENIKLH